MISNATKVWIFFLLTSMSFLILGYNLMGRAGLALGFFMAVLFNSLIFLFGESRLYNFFSLVPIRGQDAWGIDQILSNYSSKLKLPVPQVYLVESQTPTAFCLGYNERQSSICLTTSLVELLSPKELETVLAHQLYYSAQLNNFLFGITSALVNSMMGLAQTLDRILFLKKINIPHFFENLFSPLGWVLLKLSVDQRSFLDMDIAVSKVLSNRRDLAEILWRLHGLASCRPLHVPSCTHHLFILNPDGLSKKNLIFKTHPSIQMRLENLIGYYPI